VAIALAAAAAGPARAQAKAEERRCRPPLLPADTAGRVDVPPGYVLKVMAGFIVAPPLLLRLRGFACEDPDDRELGFARDHVAVFAGGGGLLTGGWRGGPAASAEVETVVRGAYGTVRGERYWFGGERVDLWDARVGYLFHPVRTLSGGVTVGYRGASGGPRGWAVEGVQVGLPLVVGACPEKAPCWVHWEPTFVIGRGSIDVSPRARLDFTVPRSKMMVRLDIDSKGNNSRDPFVVTLSLGLRP
jgi:hypothetical protein